MLAFGTGEALFIRWHDEDFEINTRSRIVTIELLKLLGTHALLDYVDAHECLPRNVDDLVPYLDLRNRVSSTGANYSEFLEKGLDAWGHDLRMYIDTEAGSVILVSPGPDGHENNRDDVVFVDDLLPNVPRCPH